MFLIRSKKKEEPKIQIHIAVIIVAVFALILSIVANVRMPSSSRNVSYRIYIGLTDEKAQYQLMPLDTAKEIVKTTCIKNSVGYTISDADGGYKDSNGLIHAEKSIVLELWHINNKTLKSILSDLSTRLNTGDIEVEKTPINLYKWKTNKSIEVQTTTTPIINTNVETAEAPIDYPEEPTE